MSATARRQWEKHRTRESRAVEDALKRHFAEVDAYRYNSASLRVRVIDPRFEGKTTEQRDAMVEPFLRQLDPKTQADIMNLLTLFPGETGKSSKAALLDLEFNEPTPSRL